MQQQFERKLKLTPTQLNDVAVSVYWILSQLEYPNSPLEKLPQFSTEELYALDSKFIEVRTTKNKLTVAVLLSTLTLMLVDLLALFTKSLPFSPLQTHRFSFMMFFLLLSMMAVLNSDKSHEKLEGLLEKLNLFHAETPIAECYKEWFSFIIEEMKNPQSLILNLPNAANRAIQEKIAEALFMIHYAPLLYYGMFHIAPAACPIFLMSIEDAHSSEIHLKESGIYGKLYNDLKPILMFGTYAGVFSLLYLNEEIKKFIYENTYTADEHVRVSAVSLGSFCASLCVKAFLNNAVVRRITVGTVQKTVEIVSNPRAALASALSACPSWQAHQQSFSINEPDLEAGRFVPNERTGLLSTARS